MKWASELRRTKSKKDRGGVREGKSSERNSWLTGDVTIFK